jgi:hypothetical protein
MAGFSVERIVFLSLVLDLFGAYLVAFRTTDCPYAQRRPAYAKFLCYSVHNPAPSVPANN